VGTAYGLTLMRGRSRAVSPGVQPVGATTAAQPSTTLAPYRWPCPAGWVDDESAAALEHMYGGDSALVSMQYSYLPSWVSPAQR
jgi:alpha/beta hydrolase family protein